MSVHKSRCAVCGGNIEDVVRHTHGSEEYHFCSQECRMDFVNKDLGTMKKLEVFS